MATFIGYPRDKVLAVMDTPIAADQAIEAAHALGLGAADVERFAGSADADRFDATGARHGLLARLWRTVQSSLKDQLPAMALGTERPEPGTMARPPKPRRASSTQPGTIQPTVPHRRTGPNCSWASGRWAKQIVVPRIRTGFASSQNSRETPRISGKLVSEARTRRQTPARKEQTTRQRSAAVANLPTVGEAGVPGYEVGSWYGFAVPTGTPKEIIARLNGEAAKVVAYPDVKERLDASGFEIQLSTPEEFGAFVRSEIAKWAKVVKDSGVHVE